jgi:hypothetical protein
MRASNQLSFTKPYIARSGRALPLWLPLVRRNGGWLVSLPRFRGLTPNPSYSFKATRLAAWRTLHNVDSRNIVGPDLL